MTQTPNFKVKAHNFLLRSARGETYAKLLDAMDTGKIEAVRGEFQFVGGDYQGWVSTGIRLLIGRGLIACTVIDPRRRTYALSDTGRACLAAYRELHPTGVEHVDESTPAGEPEQTGPRDKHGVAILPGASVLTPHDGVGTSTTISSTRVLVSVDGRVAASTHPEALTVIVTTGFWAARDSASPYAESCDLDGRAVEIRISDGVIRGRIVGAYLAESSTCGRWEATAYEVEHTDHPSYASYQASLVTVLPEPVVQLDRPTRTVAVVFSELWRAGVCRKNLLRIMMMVLDVTELPATAPVTASQFEIIRSQISASVEHFPPLRPGRPVPGHPFRVLGLDGHEMPRDEWSAGYRRCELCELCAPDEMIGIVVE